MESQDNIQAIIAIAEKSVKDRAKHGTLIEDAYHTPESDIGHSLVVLTDEEDAERVEGLAEITLEMWRAEQEMAQATATGPLRRTGIAKHASLESLITHTKRFADTDSAVFADPAARTITAILDYHRQGAEGATRWGRHRGTYPCPLSEAWIAWGGVAGLSLSQEAFAALLDSRDRELATGTLPSGIAAPDPSYLVTLAGNLDTFSTANTKRVRDPQSGRVRLSYSEESGVVGDVVPPPAFLVKIPVFGDSPEQALEVRLRVEVRDAVALFVVRLHAAAEVLRDEFEAVAGRVGTATGLPVMMGTAEV